MTPLEIAFLPSMREKLARGIQTEDPTLRIEFSHSTMYSYEDAGGLIPKLIGAVSKISSLDQLRDESGEWRFVVPEGVFLAPKDILRTVRVGRIPSIGREGKIITSSYFKIFHPTPVPPPAPPKMLCLR